MCSLLYSSFPAHSAPLGNPAGFRRTLNSPGGFSISASRKELSGAEGGIASIAQW